jgi:hypothetical protein
VAKELRHYLTRENSLQENNASARESDFSQMRECLKALLVADPAIVYIALRDTFAKLTDIPLWDLLAIPEPEMPRRDDLASVSLTDSLGTGMVPLEGWGDWSEFEEEVKLHAQQHFGSTLELISRSSCSWGDSVRYLELSSEMKLDVNLKHVYDKVNTVLERTGFPIMIQGGKHQEGRDKKIPDLAANTTMDMKLPAPRRYNRCPGELKPSIKFGTTMKNSADPYQRKQAYLTVYSQLHHYMNAHSAKTGYILTDKELIAMKRYGDEWGLVKVSKPIPFHPTKCGALNAKIALWFLVSRYGCHMTEWCYESFENPPVVHQTVDEAAGEETPTGSVVSESEWTESEDGEPKRDVFHQALQRDTIRTSLALKRTDSPVPTRLPQQRRKRNQENRENEVRSA